MTESDIYEAIRAVHKPPEWACFRDVENATGHKGDRRADAVAMNLYPSRGLELRGFEIKVSRADLRRELDDPDKAEAVGRFCHTWWLVVPDGLTDKDAIPAAWGIMEFSEKGLRTKRAAAPRPSDEVVAPTRLFVAALARASLREVDRMRKEWVPRDSIEQELARRYLDGVEAAPREMGSRMEALLKKVAGARPILAALGIDIDAKEWSERLDADTGKDAAEALAIGRCLMQKYRGGAIHAQQQIDWAIGNLEKVRKSLDELLAGKKAEVEKP